MSDARIKTPTSVSELILDPRNANRGTPRGRRLLAHSLASYGAGRSVLVDRHGVLIAGNKTFEQARALGFPVKVVPTTGRELIALKRTDLDLETDLRALELALAENRAGEVGLSWDPEQLAWLKRAGAEMTPWFTEAEFAGLVGASETDEKAEAVRAPGPTSIRFGDLFALGEHRLLCGDATDAGDVASLLVSAMPNLMTTDPPCGVDLAPEWRHEVYPRQRTAVGRVANDTTDDWQRAYELFAGNVVYAWHAASSTATVATSLEAAGFALRAQIIWTSRHGKRADGFSRLPFQHRNRLPARVEITL